MDRAERTGFGIAVVGHLALFAILSLSLFSARIPKPPVADPMDVQFIDKVGLTSAAPKVAQEAPAPSEAPDKGAPEDSAPPPPAPEPEPAPKPTPAPPKPVTKPAPEKPAPAPKPIPKPEPKPEKPKPVEKPKPEKVEKPDKAKPDKAKPEKSEAKPDKTKPATTPKKAGLPSDFLKDLPKDSQGKGQGSAKPKGTRIGSDFLKGLSPDKSPGKASAPRAAVGAQAMSGLGALIKQQVKPNYNPPTGGADVSSIVTTLHIRMRRDGSVESVEVVGHEGVNGSNRAYVQQADDAARRAVNRSSPLNLPPNLYDGGWEDITLNFRPDQMQ